MKHPAKAFKAMNDGPIKEKRQQAQMIGLSVTSVTGLMLECVNGHDPTEGDETGTQLKELAFEALPDTLGHLVKDYKQSINMIGTLTMLSYTHFGHMKGIVNNGLMTSTEKVEAMSEFIETEANSLMCIFSGEGKPDKKSVSDYDLPQDEESDF